MNIHYTPIAEYLESNAFVDHLIALGNKFPKNLLDSKVDSSSLLSLINFCKIPQTHSRHHAPFFILFFINNYLSNETLGRLIKNSNEDPL